MNIVQNISAEVRADTKDFLLYCDSDTYTYDRIYNTRTLLRDLDMPAYRDICTWVNKALHTLLTNKMIKGSVPSIDRSNEAEIKQTIKDILEKQVRSYTGNPKANIDPVDIEKIREERQIFIEQRKEREALAREIKQGSRNNPFGGHIRQL